jgi:hypothetical protein
MTQNAGQEESLSLKLNYRVARGGAWGDYDFWIAVIAGVVSNCIFALSVLAIRPLAKKIWEVLKSSRAEKDKFESARFSLLVEGKEGSCLLLELMRSATFRRGEPFAEKEIYDAIVSAVTEFNRIINNAPPEPFFLLASLYNSDARIEKFSLRTFTRAESNAYIESLTLDAESGKAITVMFDNAREAATQASESAKMTEPEAQKLLARIMDTLVREQAAVGGPLSRFCCGRFAAGFPAVGLV